MDMLRGVHACGCVRVHVYMRVLMCARVSVLRVCAMLTHDVAQDGSRCRDVCRMHRDGLQFDTGNCMQRTDTC